MADSRFSDSLPSRYLHEAVAQLDTRMRIARGGYLCLTFVNHCGMLIVNYTPNWSSEYSLHSSYLPFGFVYARNTFLLFALNLSAYWACRNGGFIAVHISCVLGSRHSPAVSSIGISVLQMQGSLVEELFTFSFCIKIHSAAEVEVRKLKEVVEYQLCLLQELVKVKKCPVLALYSKGGGRVV
ncbi:hypothetical protein J6590_004960 [Homalodisca vitripennis]|nr:hypothetical protein J6590_004960 [Homalodisca vitripennis]